MDSDPKQKTRRRARVVTTVGGDNITFDQALALAEAYKAEPCFFNGCSWMVSGDYIACSRATARRLADMPGTRIIFSGAIGGRPCEIVVQD